jgi:ketosteroid isomerase-like protein
VGLLEVAVLGGCSSAPPGETRAAAPDSAATHAAVESLVVQHHAGLQSGDFEAWGRTLAPDVVMIAADPDASVAGRDSALVEVRRHFDPALRQGLRLALRSTDLRIGLAPSRAAAWVSDVIAYGVDLGGQHAESVLRFTGVAERRDTAWVFRALHFSRPVTPEAAEAQTARGSHEPNDPGSWVAPDAEPIAERVRSADRDGWPTLVAERADAFVLGPAAEDRALGAAAARELLARLDPGGSTARSVRAGRTGDGTVGFWSGVLPPRFDARPGSRPVWRRGTLVFLEEAGAWKLVQAHLSVGVKDADPAPAPATP